MTFCSGQIEGCIFRNNRSDWGGELDECSEPAYSCFAGATGGVGNLDCDPCFVDSGHWDANGTPEDLTDDFWVEGDYHLKSEGWRWDVARGVWTWDDVTSRCIDAGNPSIPLGDEAVTLDVDPGNEYGVNLRVNMGAYGGTSEASMGPWGWSLECDVNNDGAVDAEDLAAMAGEWLGGGEAISDFDSDGSVAGGDFALLGMEWLEETSRH